MTKGHNTDVVFTGFCAKDTSFAKDGMQAGNLVAANEFILHEG